MPDSREEQPLLQLYSIAQLAGRWGVSPDTIRRLINSGELRSVTISARRLIPLPEIERAELVGVGTCRNKQKIQGATLPFLCRLRQFLQLPLEEAASRARIEPKVLQQWEEGQAALPRPAIAALIKTYQEVLADWPTSEEAGSTGLSELLAPLLENSGSVGR